MNTVTSLILFASITWITFGFANNSSIIISVQQNIKLQFNKCLRYLVPTAMLFVLGVSVSLVGVFIHAENNMENSFGWLAISICRAILVLVFLGYELTFGEIKKLLSLGIQATRNRLKRGNFNEIELNVKVIADTEIIY